MKKGKLILLLLIAFNTANAQFSLDHYYPKKLIKKLSIDSCNLYKKNKDGTFSIDHIYVYNKQSLEVESKGSYENFIYIYNAAGVQVAEYNRSLDGKSFERDTLLYDRKGRLVKRISYNKDGSETKRSEYTYKGDLLKEDSYILSGNLHSKTIYHYDKKKIVQKEEGYFRGKYSGDYVYEYDSNGKKSAFFMLDENGDTTLTHRYQYNAMGLRIKHSIYSKDGQLSMVFLTTYDKKGLILFKETITDIKDNNILTGTAEKTIYKYSYRIKF